VEVLAVRGERWCAYRARVEAAGNVVEVLYVEQLDKALEKAELTIGFDPEDVEEAIAELDRLWHGAE
jgi:hypothetical protein